MLDLAGSSCMQHERITHEETATPVPAATVTSFTHLTSVHTTGFLYASMLAMLMARGFLLLCYYIISLEHLERNDFKFGRTLTQRRSD